MADQSEDEQRRDFWQTLLAMGFDPQTSCTGTYSGIGLDAHVFQRGIYHMKAAELIFHFLFTKLDSARFKREFFDSWPIADPRQARDFRAHAFKWLEEIRRDSVEKQDGRWPVEVPVRRSYIDECKGMRFEEVLWSLARFVAHTLLCANGAWAKYLKHPMIIHTSGAVDRGMANSIAHALNNSRTRYARRLRDRLRAQETWRQTESELKEQIDATNNKRNRVHEAYRILRMKMGHAEGASNVPEVDASVQNVERTLGLLVDEAKRLWDESAGWVEKNKHSIDMVDAIIEQRANAVKLDGNRHVRLAPPPQLAADWARWLAENKATPFRGADIDLQVVARMAGACVGALRRSISSPEGTLALEGTAANAVAEDLPIFNADAVASRVQQLDEVLGEQETRIERLKRARMQLMEQRDRAERIVREQQASRRVSNKSEYAATDSVATPKQHTAGGVQVGHLAAAISRFAIRSSPQEKPDASGKKTTTSKQHSGRRDGSSVAELDNACKRTRMRTMRQLHDLWDSPAGSEKYPEQVASSAWPGLAGSAMPSNRLSLMSFMSDNSSANKSMLLSGSRKRTFGSVTEQTLVSDVDDLSNVGQRSLKRRAFARDHSNDHDESMLVDEGVPEFLVD
ncbi:hypothetical protein GGI25_004749 [Coemansia spiralis]|uniref:HAUS augmin-like complex subunit 6 N-terminal domain-containing protein n=2 Tax=Coemansia TaxID=4863 RepID=A0A9W8G529_9FUNG|nr:hypothetical protein EDC05_004521 [Coemansia umbellata]KAJ2620530.1 hypothetical protein GGI26_004937 [Coemansia sp. RSA 1358]KAJ2673414.1 hypothetical protein GGI25_004749 [Coemansia spiralis]